MKLGTHTYTHTHISSSSFSKRELSGRHSIRISGCDSAIQEWKTTQWGFVFVQTSRSTERAHAPYRGPVIPRGLMDSCLYHDRVKVNTEVHFLFPFTSRYCHLPSLWWPKRVAAGWWDTKQVCVRACMHAYYLQYNNGEELVAASRICKDFSLCVCMPAWTCHPRGRKTICFFGFLCRLSVRANTRAVTVPFMAPAASVFLASLGRTWWMSDHTIVCSSESVAVHFPPLPEWSLHTCVPPQADNPYELHMRRPEWWQ